MDSNRGRPNAQSASEIAEDHALLQQTLKRLRDAKDINTTVRTLDDLRTLLERHFVEEEAPDGLAANVGDSAPQLVATLNDLMEEHPVFLQTIGTIRAQAEAINKSTADLQTAVGQLIHDHQPWISHQSPAYGHHLLLPSTQRLG